MKRPSRQNKAIDVRLSAEAEAALSRFQANLTLVLSMSILALIAFGVQVRQDDRLHEAAVGLSPVMPAWAALLAILALVGLNGVFVAAETAIELLRPMHLKFFKENNPSQATRIQDILDNRDRYAAATSLGSQIMRVLLVVVCFLMSPHAVELAGYPISLANMVAGTLVIMIPVGLINLVFAELVPKSFATLHPPKLAALLHRFVKVVSVLFAPLSLIVTGVANLFTRRFGAKATFAMPNAAEEEIKTIVETAEGSGEIDEEEKELLHSVFEFSDTIAREVMTPRVDLDAAPIKVDPTELMRMIQESGHSRIPLYEDTDDQIIGIIHAKDLLMAMLNGKAPNLRTLMRPALFVPENKNLHELLKEMKQNRTQMAVVQDEFGGTAGIVTIEDIVEELVGDIVDEYDVEEPDVMQIEGGWLVDGKTHVDDLNSEIDSEFVSEEFDTVGGFVFGLFGRQPHLHEHIDHNGYRFTVADTDGRRIARLKVEKLESEIEEETADSL